MVKSDSFQPIGRRLDNLNRKIKIDHPEDMWVMEDILDAFLSIIDSSSSLKQQLIVSKELNRLFDTYEFRYNTILETIIMSNEFKRMQELAGVPVTEAITPKKKKSLKENFVGFGAINNPFLEREKTDYEMAFDHYVNKTHLKEEETPVSEEASNSEVRLSNEILNFLEERGIIDPSDAQKVHKDLTDFLKSKTPTPDRILSKSDYINGIRSKSDYIDGIEENENPTDEIKIDVPLFIRLLEYAREDAKTDMDLHDVAERITDLSRHGECLGMVDYEAIVGGPEGEVEERPEMEI